MQNSQWENFLTGDLQIFLFAPDLKRPSKCQTTMGQDYPLME